jgi:DNA-binding XRE family transcriptional regulator
MPAKPVFTDEQYEVLHSAALRVWRKHFKDQPKAQVKMAHALGISQQSVSKLLKGEYRPGIKVATEIAVLDGKEDLEDLVGDFATPSQVRSFQTMPAPASGSFANLDVCIAFHAPTKHWSPWTVAAARAGFFGQADFAPAEWGPKLDTLEKALDRARSR